MEIVSIVISFVAVMISIGTIYVQIKGNQKNVNSIFANLWFDLDQVFTDHPEMHKYFYSHSTDGYMTSKELITTIPEPQKENEEEFELALCIAERIVDVFQYADLFKDSLNQEDRDSYERYRKRMLSIPFMTNVVKPIWENNGSKWIDEQKT